MNDEKYVYIQDVREKKITARSARGKRTHNGSRGGVKLPSDYMTEKEKKAMSGEVKTYRLNEPMSWDEFKGMPTDIQISYIKLLKEKYGVCNTAISKMLGVCHDMVTNHMKSKGYDISAIEHGKFDKEGWLAFISGVPNIVKTKEEPVEEVPVKITGAVAQAIEKTADEEIVRPCSGDLFFVGTADSVLDSVKHILGKGNMKIAISWEVVND